MSSRRAVSRKPKQPIDLNPESTTSELMKRARRNKKQEPIPVPVEVEEEKEKEIVLEESKIEEEPEPEPQIVEETTKEEEPEPQPEQKIEEEQPNEKPKRQRKPKEISKEYYHSSRRDYCDRMINEQGYHEYKVSPKPTNQLVKDLSKKCYTGLAEYAKQNNKPFTKKELNLNTFTKYFYRTFLNIVFKLPVETTFNDEIGKRSFGLANSTKVEVRKRIITLFNEFVNIDLNDFYKAMLEDKDNFVELNKAVKGKFIVDPEQQNYLASQLDLYMSSIQKKIQNLSKKGN